MKSTHIIYWRNAREQWGSGDGFTLTTAPDAARAKANLLARWGTEVAEIHAVYRLNPWSREA